VKFITPKTPEGAELIALLQRSFGVQADFVSCSLLIGKHNEPIRMSVEYLPVQADPEQAE